MLLFSTFRPASFWMDTPATSWMEHALFSFGQCTQPIPNVLSLKMDCRLILENVPCKKKQFVCWVQRNLQITQGPEIFRCDSNISFIFSLLPSGNLLKPEIARLIIHSMPNLPVENFLKNSRMNIHTFGGNIRLLRLSISENEQLGRVRNNVRIAICRLNYNALNYNTSAY